MSARTRTKQERDALAAALANPGAIAAMALRWLAAGLACADQPPALAAMHPENLEALLETVKGCDADTVRRILAAHPEVAP